MFRKLSIALLSVACITVLGSFDVHPQSPPRSSSGGAATRLSLVQAFICEDIKDGIPTNPAVAFPISTAKIYSYTLFDQIVEDTVVYHHWYFRDKPSARIRLSLRHPRWSTFKQHSAADGSAGASGESGYVGYEMWIRDLESRSGGIVGASGCFFAIRSALFLYLVPEALSRDFASPLVAREHGYRAVSVSKAICYVPQARSIEVEFRRKTRTMARGLETLWYKRHLLNPLRYGRFSLMLASHKLIRWIAFLMTPPAIVGLVILAPRSPFATAGLLMALVVGLVGLAAFRWPKSRRTPRAVALAGFFSQFLKSAVWYVQQKGSHVLSGVVIIYLKGLYHRNGYTVGAVAPVRIE